VISWTLSGAATGEGQFQTITGKQVVVNRPETVLMSAAPK
jgi:hypothetical protein